MASFEDLDAFKACQELTLALYKVVEVLEDFDSELSAELWSAALVAPSRLARGSGFRNRKMFWVSADRSFSALSEISYYLNLCDGLGLITKEEHQRLESLRGRAAFYTMRLVCELARENR